MPRTQRNRRQRLALGRTALAGFIAGTTRAVIGWLLDQLRV
ncbi:hypothetical protein [Streptomyces lunaelactis]|nr:hypothetical protein [Streptomyces lunaelactis]